MTFLLQEAGSECVRSYVSCLDESETPRRDEAEFHVHVLVVIFIDKTLQKNVYFAQKKLLSIRLKLLALYVKSGEVVLDGKH